MSLKDELNPELGVLMRNLRERAGLSQTEVATRSGFSLPEISRWENSHRMPKADTLLIYAAACGFEPAFKARKTDDQS